MKSYHDELKFIVTGLLSQNLAAAAATDYVIDKFNREYAYDWKDISKDVAITFTGFKAANPFGTFPKKFHGKEWHLLIAQVCIFHRTWPNPTNKTSRGWALFRNITLSDVDERWNYPDKMLDLVTDAERRVRLRAHRLGWV